MNRQLISRSSLVFIALAAAALACSVGGSSDADREATVAALGESIRLTSTAAAASGLSSAGNIQTAQAQATAQSQAILETQNALASLSEEQKAATAEAFAPYRAELPKYGVDPENGRPGWIHPPVTLDIEGYMQYDYANQYIGTVAADFVVSADITWNTFTGLSGCGFVLRSDGNQDGLNQYLVIATRGASGHVVFGVMVDGELVTGRDIYAYGIDPQFEWRNDTTNRLTVVGRGSQFAIYTNGTLIGEVNPNDPPPQPYVPPPPQAPEDPTDAEAMADYVQRQAEYQTVVAQIRAEHRQRMETFEQADKEFDRGFIAMVGLSESGRTICQYDNAWLWLIGE